MRTLARRAPASRRCGFTLIQVSVMVAVLAVVVLVYASTVTHRPSPPTQPQSSTVPTGWLPHLDYALMPAALILAGLGIAMAFGILGDVQNGETVWSDQHPVVEVKREEHPFLFWLAIAVKAVGVVLLCEGAIFVIQQM